INDSFMSNDPSGYPNIHESHLVTRGGERRFYRWSNVAVLDKAGRISLVIGIGEDITVAAQARRLRERSTAAMNDAQRMAGIRYCFSSPQLSAQESETYSFYTRMAEILEVPPTEMPREQEIFLNRFVHPDDRDETRRHFHAFTTGQSDQYLIEYRVYKPSGEMRYIREGIKRLIDAVDNSTQSVGVIHDITDIKRTQLALERNAALMSRAQSIAKMCHWYFEPAANPKAYDDGQYFYSDNAADIFGLPPSRLNMRETEFAATLVHPDDREFVYDSYRAFVEGPEMKYERVYRLLLPEGTLRYISDAGEKRLSADGKLTLILGISQDVTTLHLSEASLRRTESQLRHALRIAAMGHWHVEYSDSTERRYVMQYSDEAAAIFGVTPDILSQLDIAAFVGRFVLPDDQPQTLDRMQQFWSDPEANLSVEFQMLRSDGSIRAVRVIAERVRMTHPSLVQMVGVVQDITDLRHHEMVLRQTEVLLQHAHRLAKIGYWLWHPSETLDSGSGKLSYSEGLQAMLGIDGMDYHGADEIFCQRHVHSDDRAAVLQAFVDYRRGLTDSYNLEYRFLRPDGRTLNLRSVAMRVRDEGNHVLYAIGVAQDISEQKRHEEELIQAKNEADLANRSKTEFLANMSHELRTPLNAVIGFSQLIRDQAFGANPDRYISYADDINTSGKLLLDLINDILDMSRIEAGRHVLSEEELPIATAIYDCLRLVSPRASDGNVILDFQPAPGLPFLLADARSLKQILLNVVSNAVKFTPAHGQVSIHVSIRKDGSMQVVVSDTGIGIAADVLPKLFAPFRQGDNSISRRFGGTGLGLAISRKLIELHDGSIEIDSLLGQGTTVRLVFPAARIRIARQDGLDRNLIGSGALG
ncbi:MAG: PAS domain-containing protein, partial [Dongiaceae bacterium]